MIIDPIPPILNVIGLKLIEIGENDHGAYLKFASNRLHVREVTVYMMTQGPVRWTYAYAIWDPATHTVISYQGNHGDPTKDTIVDIGGT